MLTLQGGSDLEELKAFIRSDILYTDVIEYLHQKYQAKSKIIYKDLESQEDVLVSSIFVRMKELSFTVQITQYLTDTASKRASKEIYLSSEQVKDADSLTQVLFSHSSLLWAKAMWHIITDITSHFGGGYIISSKQGDTSSEYLVIEPSATKGYINYTNVFLSREDI